MHNPEQEILRQFHFLIVGYLLRMEMTSSCLRLSPFFHRARYNYYI